jgi:hypothetical protein
MYATWLALMPTAAGQITLRHSRSVTRFFDDGANVLLGIFATFPNAIIKAIRYRCS